MGGRGECGAKMFSGRQLFSYATRDCKCFLPRTCHFIHVFYKGYNNIYMYPGYLFRAKEGPGAFLFNKYSRHSPHSLPLPHKINWSVPY